MGHTSSIRADFYSIGAFDWGASSTVCQCLSASAHFGHLQISPPRQFSATSSISTFYSLQTFVHDRAPPCKAPPSFVFDKKLVELLGRPTGAPQAGGMKEPEYRSLT